MIETRSELLEFRDELGWVDQKDQPETIRMLVSVVMDCLTEIDSLRNQVNNLGEIIHRIENPLQ